MRSKELEGTQLQLVESSTFSQRFLFGAIYGAMPIESLMPKIDNMCRSKLWFQKRYDVLQENVFDLFYFPSRKILVLKE